MFLHLMCRLTFVIVHHEIIYSAQFSLNLFCDLLYCSFQPLGEVIVESGDKVNDASEFEQDNNDGEDGEIATVKGKLWNFLITWFDQAIVNMHRLD